MERENLKLKKELAELKKNTILIPDIERYIEESESTNEVQIITLMLKHLRR